MIHRTAPDARGSDSGHRRRTGAYSLYFAQKGYSVSALELAARNIAAFRANMTETAPVELVQGNALDQCRALLCRDGVHIKQEIAADGVSELLADTINRMDDETYAQYLRYHFYLCEKPECLGMSNHWLFVGTMAES